MKLYYDNIVASARQTAYWGNPFTVYLLPAKADAQFAELVEGLPDCKCVRGEPIDTGNGEILIPIEVKPREAMAA